MKKLILAILAIVPLLLPLPSRAAGDLAVVAIPATITSGTALSPAIDLQIYRLFAISMPASWTAAPITFQASIDGVNYFNVYDDTGTEVSITVAASQYVVLTTPAKMLGARWLKVRSGPNSVPVNQGSTVVVNVVGVP